MTLIELLVVIAIIAVLVSLLAAGVMSAFWKVPEVRTRTEISQMEVALASFMSEYQLSTPPPSKLLLCEDLNYQPIPGDPNAALRQSSGAFLHRCFGKNLGAGTAMPANPKVPWVDWNGDGIPNGPWTLEGECCLVFYLGGIPNPQQWAAGAAKQCQGFAYSNMNPAMLPNPAAPQRRKGPYFDFKASRLASTVGGFFYYLDAWETTPPMPYVFFSSSGVNNGYSITDCQRFDVIGPYMTGTGAYTNPNTYQIISAGKDGKFGGSLWNPSIGASGFGQDDQANFSSKILGAGQQ